MMTVNIIKIGNSEGVILPKEILAKLRSSAGNKLYITEMPDSSIRLSPHNELFARTMEAAEQVMREDREVLRKLAE
jgi:putative addiction module antidote